MYTLEMKQDLENLYNQLLLQHNSLPSDAHREWNTLAMQAIDVKLSELEKEFTIDIKCNIEEAETQEVQNNYYEPTIYGNYELVNETTIELYAQDNNGWDVKIARFNFLNNCGYYYDLNGTCHSVERYSNILRNLNKIDNVFYGINETTVKNIKKHVRKIRREQKNV